MTRLKAFGTAAHQYMKLANVHSHSEYSCYHLPKNNTRS